MLFIGRTDAEAEAPTLRLPDTRNQLTVKDPDAGRDWEKEEKAVTEDETGSWHHRLSGHEFEQTQKRVGDRGACNAAAHGITESNIT